MSVGDTIVAPATPPGRSALAVVRIDGPQSAAILASLTRAALPSPRLVSHKVLYRAGDSSILDDCVVVRYESPHSFTGNDLVEITLHGNPVLVERLIAECSALGARLAEPGEFTERAVLNGKLDLVQAESIGDLINSRTALQAKVSLSNLEGVLSRKASSVRATLLDVISRLEAALDFSEEGYEFIARDEAEARMRGALDELAAMAETYRRGCATISGLDAVILGRPNAGKSTLLNRLVGSDRAIVTAMPGTTRDIVRETIEVGGLPVTFADTAGLRTGADLVEEIGIARARAAAQDAGIVLYLVDAQGGFSDEDERELAGLVNPVLVFSKVDLAPGPPGSLGISVAAEIGIDLLLGRLDELVRERFVAPEGALVNERQRIAVEESVVSVEAALAAIRSGCDEQLILVDLYSAASSLGRLTGEITTGDVLSAIFGKFCIGK